MLNQEITQLSMSAQKTGTWCTKVLRPMDVLPLSHAINYLIHAGLHLYLGCNQEIKVWTAWADSENAYPSSLVHIAC